jgi:hypothetical protein
LKTFYFCLFEGSYEVAVDCKLSALGKITRNIIAALAGKGCQHWLKLMNGEGYLQIKSGAEAVSGGTWKR